MAVETYEWKLYCETESIWIYMWASDAPTSCPNNAAHTITSGSISQVNELSDESSFVRMYQSYYTSPDTANTTQWPITIDVSSGDLSSVCSPISFPFNVDMICGFMIKNPNGQYGDSLDGYVQPLNNGNIGTVTAVAVSGQKILYASPGSFSYIVPGHYILFGDDTKEYLVASIDLDNNKVILLENLLIGLSVDDGIKLRVKTLNKQYLSPGEERTHFCTQVSDVKGLPTTMETCVKYNHAGSGATADGTLYGNLIYRYG